MRAVSGWIKKGERKEIPTNGSHRRLNVLGALDLEAMHLETQQYETVNGAAIVAFFDHLQKQYPRVTTLHIILDRAGYHRCKEVLEYVEKSNGKIVLHSLPPYSPNLNAIEPAWKIMHEHTTNNRYYPTFKDFTEAINTFFCDTFPQKARSWMDRLTDNFRVIQSPLAAKS